MAPDKSHMPFERHDGFRNPQNVKVETWDCIKPIAEKVFQFFEEESPDFDWAKKAWRLVEKTPLAQYSDEFEHLRVMIRLFAVAELLHMYGHYSGMQQYNRFEKYWEWVDECELSRFKLALMCGEKYWEDRFVDSEDGECAECVDLLVGEEYRGIVEILRSGFGGDKEMLQSILDSIEGTDREDELEIGMTGQMDFEVSVSRQVYEVTTWQHSGWPREGDGSV